MMKGLGIKRTWLIKNIH